MTDDDRKALGPEGVAVAEALGDQYAFDPEQRTLRRVDLATLPASERTVEPASVQFWRHAPYTAGEHWTLALVDAECERIWASDQDEAGGAT